MTAPFAIVPLQAMRDTSISGNAKALLALLAGEETLENRRWVRLKQKPMGEQIGVARETISRLVKTLYNAGYLEVRDVTSKGRGRVSLEYRIRHDLDDAVAVAEEKPTTSADVTPASRTKSRCDEEIIVDLADVTLPPERPQADVTLASLPIKNSNTELNTDRLEPSGESGKTRKRVRTPTTRIAFDAEYTPDFQQIAAEAGLMNGTGAAVFRNFCIWYSDRGIRSANWLGRFVKWCASERTPPQESHDERIDEGFDRSRVAIQDRSRLAGNAKPMGRSGRARSRADAALSLELELAARDGDHGAETGWAEADSPPLVARII